VFLVATVAAHWPGPDTTQRIAFVRLKTGTELERESAA
jgi:hypothetical protein